MELVKVINLALILRRCIIYDIKEINFIYVSHLFMYKL